MSKRDLLLEIGTEEIPARFMEPVLKQMEQIATNLFGENRIVFNNVKTFGTPRRLTLLIEGVGERQADLEEQKKGPARNSAFDAQGKPTRAAVGFAKSQGVSVEDLEVKDFQGGDYVFAIKRVMGQDSRSLLPSLMQGIIKELHFPKPMYWSSKDFRFARPIRWLLALYGKDEVVFPLDELESGRFTYGHRFLAPGPFEVKDIPNYFQIMEDSYVLLDQEKRRGLIREQAEKAARNLGGTVHLDEELLEEVNYLVEYPQAVVGEFSSDYLEIPKEVLITSMQSHQRYFPVVGEKGLMPNFITISNAREDLKGNIKMGNERVLRARLADARFFYSEDQKTSPEQYVEKLESVLFQEGLGTMLEKTWRLTQISQYMADCLGLEAEDKKTSARIAHLCKYDLLTNMVYEFPEVQGIMGREYALLSGETQEVSHGIYEHYLPRFAGDDLPESLTGSLVSIADKLDNIVGCFGIGIKPTGSQDPYALRRQALGIMYILLDSEISLSLSELIGKSVDYYSPHKLIKDKEEIITEVLEFLRQRIRNIFLEKGLRYDLIDAVLSSGFDVLPHAYKRAVSLSREIDNSSFLKLMTAYTRAANLSKNASAGDSVKSNLLEALAEKELYKTFQKISEEVAEKLSAQDYEGVLAQFSKMQEPVNNFFDQVMVMVEDEKVKNNRLNLLREIRDMFHKFADFGKIVITHS
ncbi:glycine--tRNA ligase subunit beta [Candidatus Contubernalis alkaliaceticus]|uniref:glycine--tRNA ligase subunit beta n=1 Tax=Candidatus Contubernalis alkaliaceticus TaxID=338645 RepID=UPI001F4BEA94|nr:glycine--tRNA ligase subunit beta [Candidatus Contubernalis alkalaceticus]UNC92992.1 glycine--tRNA ligase subunit beta [Candidatus Contubernalis alkalaceticus]